MLQKLSRLMPLVFIPLLYVLLRPTLLEWAEDWEWATLFVGIFLLALEVFIIPGFGVAGISAFVLMYVGLVFILLNNKGLDFSELAYGDITQAMLLGALALCLVIGFLLAALPNVLRSQAFQDFTNTSTLHKNQGFVALHDLPALVGKQGMTETILRPSGKILVDNVLYDATTFGDFISKGVQIEVVGQDGAALRVKKS